MGRVLPLTTPMKTVYVTLSEFCQHDDRPRQLLKEAGFQVLENKTGRRLKAEELYDCLKDVDGIVAAVEPYSADLLARLSRLKCISRCGIGTDAIDITAAQRHGIAVLKTGEEIVAPVAQMTVGMIFALARNFILHKCDFLEGAWKKHTGFLLSEWTIGLIGFGRIGRAVEHYLRVFGPKVLVHDPYLPPDTLPQGVENCGLETLLERSDLVSIHATRSLKEGYLLGREELMKMRKGSFLVNTARGYLVDEEALQEVLTTKHLKGAALDVFSSEPYHGPLVRLPNVLATPHTATLTRASRIAMELKAVQNLAAYLRNGSSK